LLLLDYLLEVDVRRLYAIKAYSTLFEYVVKEQDYSEPAAAERIRALLKQKKTFRRTPSALIKKYRLWNLALINPSERLKRH